MIRMDLENAQNSSISNSLKNGIMKISSSTFQRHERRLKQSLYVKVMHGQSLVKWKKSKSKVTHVTTARVTRGTTLVKSSPRQHKPTKVKIAEYIQCQPMHMIKELHNKVRVTLWERDMSLYHIN
jgi:hypothetical protein